MSIESKDNYSCIIDKLLYYGNKKPALKDEELSNMGIKCENKKARKINRNDYDNFDYIICMEKSNIISLKNILDDYDNKIFRLLDFSDNPRDISDPWYTRNFEVCYNDIMEGLNCFIKYLGY